MSTTHPAYLRSLSRYLQIAHPELRDTQATLEAIATRIEKYEAAEDRQAAKDRIKWATRGLDEPPFRHGPPPAQPNPETNADGLAMDSSKLLQIASKLSQLESMGVDTNAIMDEQWRIAYEKAGLKYRPQEDYIHIETYRAPGARSIVRDGRLIIEPLQNHGHLAVFHGKVDGPAMVEVKRTHWIWPDASELEGPPLPPLEYLTWDHVAKLTRREIRAQYGEQAVEWARCQCVAGVRWPVWPVPTPAA